MPAARILIVDDEPLQRWVVREQLQSWGYTAEEADSSATALDRYRAANPDPEIMDIIRRGLPLLKRLAALARPFRRWSKRGIPRVLIMVDVFSARE